MPGFDLPLERLWEYQGSTPCPEDFADYWDRALAELDRVDPCPELLPSSFQTGFAQCFDLYFTGVRGARIHAQYSRPGNGEGPYPALLVFHGYMGSSGDWAGRLHFNAAGMAVAALDCRGQGGLSQDVCQGSVSTLFGAITRGLDQGPDFLMLRDTFLDTVQLARVVMAMEEVDPSRVAVNGVSQGGGLSLACAALVPEIRTALVRYSFLCDYKRVWQMGMDVDAYSGIRSYFRFYDPRHEREDEIFRTLGYVDCSHLASRITADVYMQTGLNDRACPPSTQFAAYNHLKGPNQMELYPDYGHEFLLGANDRYYQYLLKRFGL